MPYNGNGECEFRFTNTGDEPLLVQKPKSSCGCTIPSWPKEPILPGESEVIKVTYRTNRVGNINKTVTVTSNAVNNPSVVLRIKGRVLEQPNEAMPEKKDGKAPVSGVMEYGDRLQNTGLNLLSAPGNDLVASTALASCGCHIVLFTTGRGTPFGTFVPTMKIATNPDLACRKQNWIDFSAGQLIEGRTMTELVPEFIDKVLAVASGEKAKNEENDYREISIFKNGVTL